MRTKTVVDECAERDEVLFVSNRVLVELWWTLARTYGFGRTDIARAVRALADNITIAVEAPKAVRAALSTYENGSADFLDCLIVAKAADAGYEAIVTFDRRLRSLPSVRLL